MAEKSKVEVVTDVSRCQDIVKDLGKLDVIALDAKGVHLRKDGPLTLLQVGTLDHVVYLFDIHTNKELFKQGELQDILTSQRILKVVHSCARFSAALSHQFNIQLQNVFDTQKANQVIEEKKGKELASELTLDDLYQKYLTVAKVDDQKDVLKNKRKREEGDLWARRPMSDDLIESAAGNVTAIVPEIYITMKGYIEEHGLEDKFNDRVEEEILYYVDENMKTQRRARLDTAIRRILTNVETTSPPDLQFAGIDDEDVIMAFKMSYNRTDVAKLSPLIRRLNKEFIQQNLDYLEGKFDSHEGISSILNGHSDNILKAACDYTDKSIQDRGKALRERVTKLTLDHIQKTYGETYPVTYISRHEQDVLRWQLYPRPTGEHDRKYNRVVLALYWKLMELDLDSTIQRFEQKAKDFVIVKGYYNKIKFYRRQKTKVPSSIKRKATTFLENLDRVFGRGVVPAKQIAKKEKL